MAARYRSFTALWLGGAGDLVQRHEYGRQGLWYGQSQSGLDYPLVAPSEDVRYLFADVYLSYTDTTAPDSQFLLPFRIHWVSGFGGGSGAAENPDDPVPAHARDIIIVDANNTTVFDSTILGMQYESRDWTPWLRITRWETPDGAVCSTIHYTAWGLTDTPTPREYSQYLFPTAATLQEQAIYRLPKRVTAITAILDSITEKGITLTGGYNMGLTVTAEAAVGGGRRVTGITFDATPGAGIGLYPDCTPEDIAISTINTVAPTKTGHFFLAADGCYYARQPMRLLSESPRTLLPEIMLTPGSENELALPDTDAGHTTAADGWPASLQYTHLQLGNDCGACCDCADYVEVAEYIQTQHARYKQIGNTLSTSRYQYHDNRSQWLAAKECLQQSPVRVVVRAQQCPYADIGVQICNQTDVCMTDIVVSVSLATTPPGGSAAIVPGYTFITGPTVENGIQRVTTKRGFIESVADTYTTVVEQLTPGGSSIVRFRVAVSSCGGADIFDTGYQLRAEATATANGTVINSTPATDSDILNCPPVVTVPTPQCFRC